MVRPMRGIQGDIARTSANADMLIREIRQAVATLAPKLDRLVERVDDAVKAVREEGLSIRSEIAGYKIPVEVVIEPRDGESHE